MNENHKHDKALEDAIERVVHGKKASANELMDTLGNTKPKAEPEFMLNLEERLMAELSTAKKEKLMSKRKEIPSRFGRWPLTMAAAVMAILLVGGLVVFMRQVEDESGRNAPSQVMNPVQGVVAIQALNPGTVIEEHMVELRTFTPDPELNQGMLINHERLVVGRVSNVYVAVGDPVLASNLRESTYTPEGYVPIVIAVQDIPEGTVIEADGVVEILYPLLSDIPRGAYSSIEDVVGLVAATDIYREEVVTDRKVLLSIGREDFELTQTAVAASVSQDNNSYLSILVAIEDIPEDTIITEEMIGTTLFPIASIPSDAIMDINAVLGRRARTTIYRNEFILSRKFEEVPSAVATVDPFSLTATAIISIATASANEGCPESPNGFSTYEIQAGDTLYSIAEQFQMPVSAITELNCIAIEDIRVGDIIRIPAIAPALATPAAGTFGTMLVEMNPNAPEVNGCDGQTVFALPLNGQVISSPIVIEAMADHANFAEAKVEIAGPGTNGQYITLHTALTVMPTFVGLTQFIPSMFEDGTYDLRLQTFSTLGHLVDVCSITVYIRNESSANGLNIGVLVGHESTIEDVGAVCENGLTELPVNQAVGEALRQNLEQLGYGVTMLSENEPTAENLALTVLLHTNSCDSPSGYRLLLPETVYSERISVCAIENYGATTGLRRNFDSMEDSIPVSMVQMNPAFLIEMGSLSADAQLLGNNPQQVARGLAETINCYFGNPVTADEELIPVVIAVQDIPMNAVIREDMVSLVYWPVAMVTAYSADNAGQLLASQVENVIGMQSNAFVPAMSPISSGGYRVADDCSGDIGSGDCLYLSNAPQHVAISIITSDLNAANFVAGQPVDLVVSMIFVSQITEEYVVIEDVGESTGFQGLERMAGNHIIQRIALDALVIYTEVQESDGISEVIVTLEMPSQDATLLSWVAEAELPFLLVADEGHSQIDTSIASLPRASNGMRQVTIPVTEATSISWGLAEGDNVDILIEPINDTPSLMPVPQGGTIIWQSADSLQNPIRLSGLITIESIRAEGGESLITIEAPSDEAWLVNWYLQYGSNFTFIKK